MVGRNNASNNREPDKPSIKRSQRKVKATKPNGNARESVPYGLTGSFPATIAAAREIASEQSLWNLGDALVKECGPPSQPGEHTGSDEKLKQAQKALEQAHFKYSVEHLREVRRTAANFPTGERSPDGETIPFSLCLVAATPAKLQTARARAKEDGVKLTARFIRELGPTKPKPKPDGKGELDVASRLAAFNDDLERAKTASKQLANDLKRLSEPDRVRLLEACEPVAGKWNEIIEMLQPKKEVAPPPRRKAA